MNIKIKLFLILQITFLFAISQVFAQKTGTEKADSLFQELQKAKQDTNKVNILNNIAETIIRINPDLSRQFATDALNLSKELKWEKGQALSILRIGNTFWLTGNSKKAFDYYNKSLQLFEKLNFMPGIATATGNLGLIYAGDGKDSLALLQYNKALEIDKKLKNLKGVIRHYMNIGVLYSNKGKLKQALDNYFISLKYTVEANDPMNEGIVLGNIGNIYNKMDNFEKAIYYYKKAIDVNQKNRIYVSLSYNYYNLALLYQSKLKWNESIRILNELLKLQDDLSDNSMIISAKTALLNAYNRSENIELAYSLKKELEKELKNDIDNETKLNLYVAFAHYYYMSVIPIRIEKNRKIKDEYAINDAELLDKLIKSSYTKREKQLLDSALVWFIKSEKYIDTTKFSKPTMDVYQKMSQLYQFFDKHEKALDYHLKYSKMKDSINSNENMAAILDFESKLELEIKNKQLKIKELELQNAKTNQLFTIVALILSISLLFTFIFLYKSNVKKSEELIELNKEITESNQMKDKLFSIIAHDLINPISNFKNVSNILSDSFDTFSEDEKKEYLTLMSDASDGLMDMLKNLLDWSRMQRGQIKPNLDNINAINIVNQNINLLNLSANNKNIKLVNNVSEDSIVLCDYNLMTTVVRNILSNAIKFTPDNGEISFETENIIENNNKYILLKIIDNGVGIPADKVDKLFNFNTNTSTVGTNFEKGTGLGLVLCKDFMNVQNGDIYAESEVGKGTTMIIKIPAQTT